MAISVQQFDFLVSTRGFQTALAVAEQAGGITGTREGQTQTASGGASAGSTQSLAIGAPGTVPGATATGTSFSLPGSPRGAPPASPPPDPILGVPSQQFAGVDDGRLLEAFLVGSISQSDFDNEIGRRGYDSNEQGRFRAGNMLPKDGSAPAPSAEIARTGQVVDAAAEARAAEQRRKAEEDRLRGQQDPLILGGSGAGAAFGETTSQAQGQAQVGGTVPTEAEIIADIVNRWNAGEFGINTNLVVDAIARDLNLSRSDAAAKFEQVNTLFINPGGLRGGSPLTRGQIQQSQTDEEKLRRLRSTEFGNLTPTGNRAATAILGQFFAQQPITNVGREVPIGTAFSEFRSGRPDAASLTQGLQNIQTGGAKNPFFLNRFEGDPEAAFGASIQPSLVGVNPSIRGDISRILRNQFADRLVQQPENFQTADQILNLLTGFQGF